MQRLSHEAVFVYQHDGFVNDWKHIVVLTGMETLKNLMSL